MPVNVPLLVTGEPETVMMDGSAKATEVTYDSAGISAVVKARKVGVAAAPDEGPAKIEFTACVVSVPVRVPLLVTGEPETVMMDGNARPTEVTVPCGLAAVVMLVTRP